MPTIISRSLADTAQTAKDWLLDIRRSPTLGYARVVAMGGDLGSGKTTFVQFLAKELGVQERVVSPTFVIQKNYDLPTGDTFSHLIHIDCYRLDSPSELQHLGWDELLAHERNLIMLEWPEKVEGILPEDYLKLSFKFIDENTREISY